MPVEDACMFGEFTRVGETPFPRVCAKSRFGTANPSGKRPFRTDSNSERLVTGVYEWRSPPQLGPSFAVRFISPDGERAPRDYHVQPLGPIRITPQWLQFLGTQRLAF